MILLLLILSRFHFDETNRMMRMVTDLLHLSRIDNTTSQLDVELINFTAFITFILNRFDKMRSQDDEKNMNLLEITLLIQFGSRLIPIR